MRRGYECIHCGQDFEEFKPQRRYCSEECRVADRGFCTVEGCDDPNVSKGLCRKHGTRQKRHGSPMKVAGTPKSQPGCEYCGKLCSQRFCGPRCRARHSRGVEMHRDCKHCGTRFQPIQRSVYCSHQCRRAAATEWQVAYSRERYASDPEYRDRVNSQREASKARRRNAPVLEEFAPLEIWERDGWTCQLCGESIDRRHWWPHPESPTLDHIVPVSKGGVHSRANVQAAHLVCNTRKGNRGQDQLRLIG